MGRDVTAEAKALLANYRGARPGPRCTFYKHPKADLVEALLSGGMDYEAIARNLWDRYKVHIGSGTIRRHFRSKSCGCFRS